MQSCSLNTIREIIYSVGNLEKSLHFFVEYGGWNIVSRSESNKETLEFWGLSENDSGQEVLLQSNHYPDGQIRLVKYDVENQGYARSSQQPWDTGGIMDINLRVHEVAKSFDALRDLGWHGLSDPLLQTMGPFKLYDILMKGYDDTIIAFTHRLEPPMEEMAPINLPTHVYTSSLVVKDLEESRAFYQDVLGCALLNEYEVRKDKPQENMFGLPHNLADKVHCNANIFSFNGERAVAFQTIEFHGVTGKDFSKDTVPPNRGFLIYRVEVENIDVYYQNLVEKGATIHRPIKEIEIKPYGQCKAFAVLSPDGVWFTFYESII